MPSAVSALPASHTKSILPYRRFYTNNPLSKLLEREEKMGFLATSIDIWTSSIPEMICAVGVIHFSLYTRLHNPLRALGSVQA